MAIEKIQIGQVLLLTRRVPLLDVRSPGEYAQGHIPGALSFPLFTDDERRQIGTAYKQESREKAVKIGLGSFGVNLVKLVEEAEKIAATNNNADKELIVHCWRGGMRSAAVAWLLDLYGFKVYLLEGGYKSYRQWALKQFSVKYRLGIIGGYTGSNKTGIIKELQKTREHVIDLEALAGHKGSAFGNLERLPQPTQEQFENLFAYELNRLWNKDQHKIIWMENESQRIGNLNVPPDFYNYFANHALYTVDVAFEKRLDHIVEVYGKSSKETLINAIVRITKKLGGLEAKTAVNFLMDDDVRGCFSVLLKYYDRLYHKSEARRELDKTNVTTIECADTNARENLKKILAHAYREQ